MHIFYASKVLNNEREDTVIPRITREFPEQVDKILKELAAQGHTSKVDVIRRALGLYNYVHKEVKEKNPKLTLANEEDKILKEIVLDL